MFVLLSELGLGLSKGTALGPELGPESYMMGVPVFTSVSGTEDDTTREICSDSNPWT